MSINLKNKSKEQGSFFSLLIKNYLVFTMATIILVVCVYFAVSLRVSGVLKEARPEKLIKEQNILILGNYDKLSYRKVVGKNGYIKVLDAGNNVIYQSREMPKETFTDGILECIPETKYDNITHTLTTDEVYFEEYIDERNRRRTLVRIGTVSDYMYLDEAFMVLDEKHNIIFSSNPSNKTSFTKTEFEYMTGQFPSDYNVQKYIFSDSDGEKKTLLMYFPKINQSDFRKAITTVYISFVVFIFFYILMIIVFVHILNKKFKKPVVLLNCAILNFAKGERNGKIEYVGAKEFVQICDSFNTMADRLAESEAKRKNTENSKQKMLADISHDLKTPITVIQGYSKAICDGIVPENKKEQYLSTIYQKSILLTQLINEFYEFSKLEHPGFTLALLEDDICEYLRKYLSDKYNEIDLAGFNLEVDIPEKSYYCKFDELQLSRAFENIIINSLKHNPKGTKIYFLVKVSAENVKIIIADNGVGIERKISKSIFEPFVVGDDSRSQRQGTGLGLAITKRIIEAHNGSIRIVLNPEPPFSTEFEIILNLQ